VSEPGLFLVVVGPDGAGKTTLARSIVEQAAGRGRYFHFLPDSGDYLLDHVPEEDTPLEKHRGSGSTALGVVRILRNLARAWLSYWRLIRPAVRSSHIVVGDRWLYGYVTQPRSLRFYGPAWLARLVVRLVPRPTTTIRVTAPANVIHDRKPELTLEEIEREERLLNSLLPDALLVDGTLDPAAAALELLEAGTVAIRYRRYPPFLGHVLLPKQPKSLALAGSALYTPARRRGQVAQRASRLLLKAFGTSWLRRARLGDVPIDRRMEDVLFSFLHAHHIDPDGLALHTRAQRGRAGFVVLALAQGRPAGFLRIGDPSKVAAECQALELFEAFPPSSFRVPHLMGRLTTADVEIALHSSVLQGYHRPRREPDLGRIIAEIKAALNSLARPSGTPEHWEPMHGDLTPWNLREDRSGLSLIDWESVGWGPPAADEVLYRAASRALGWAAAPGELDPEACEFWRHRLVEADNPRDARLRHDLLTLLEGNRGLD
jgi:thymidylate kinase